MRQLSCQAGVEDCGWTREFENGLVVVNPTPLRQTFTGLGGYQRILGTQDPRHNNGLAVPDPFVVEPWDAYLLLRSKR